MARTASVPNGEFCNIVIPLQGVCVCVWWGGGTPILKMTEVLVVPFRGQKAFLLSLKTFSLKRSTVGAFAVSSRVLGSISSRFGSPVVCPPPNYGRGVGQGTRVHKTAGNRAY